MPLYESVRGLPGFSRADLHVLLEAALASGYEFRAFDDPARTQPEKVCLLRHDVDVDVGAAADVAELEASLGIRATYFLMLRSPVYNLLSRANHALVNRIVSMGHWIGLHYDQGFEPHPAVPLQQSIEREGLILEEMFGVQVGVVSFHQPGREVLANEVHLHGLVNTYDRADMRGFEYLSDSNMIWQSLPALDAFKGSVYPRLHLLIHPLWWVSEERGVTTTAAFDAALLANWRRAQEQMLQTERAFGPARSFSIRSSL
jgi:hypothetical protein